jgi:hypothetical protein
MYERYFSEREPIASFLLLEENILLLSLSLFVEISYICRKI